MSQWDRQTPGSGDRDGLNTVVSRISDHLQVIDTQASQIEQVASSTSEGWTGQAADAWTERATTTATTVRAWAEPLRAGGQAISDYASAIASIAARTDQALADIAHAQTQTTTATHRLTSLHADPDTDDFEMRLAQSFLQARQEDQAQAALTLDALSDERRTADQALIAGLQAATPATWSSSGGLAATLDPGVFAGDGVDLSALGLWASGLPAGEQGDAALRWLAGQLSDADLEALQTRCPTVAARLMHEDTSGAFATTWPDLAAALDVQDPDARIAAVDAAFAAMSDAQRAALVRTYPGVVNNLDGAPLSVRITANRTAIRAEIANDTERLAQVEGILAALALGGNSAPIDLKNEQAALREQIPWYQSLLSGDPDDPGDYKKHTPPSGHQVVLFDPADGQFGELVGSLDAPNVGVLIGGTGTHLTNMDGQFDRAWDLVAAGQNDLAVITYLGGPMPQNLAEAAGTSYADTIAPRLASFANGVRKTTDATITAAGHSYGGRVVGGAEAAGMVVDRVLLIEASGSGVRSIDDYAAPGTPRYTMTAPGDLIEEVQDLEVQGMNPNKLPGVIRLETGRVDDNDHTSGLVQGVSSHGDVFHTKTTAWKNIFNVMDGGKVDLWTPPTTTVNGPTTPDGVPATTTTYPMADPDYTPPTQDVP